ncbi:MAG: aldehyde dehydrogenase family protein, partial [Chthoniobacteraceae bacterium]
VCADADIDLAADAVADALCLTCGQRCNATSRVLVDGRIARPFEERLLASLRRYQPGDPLLPTTTLGPLISQAAVERYSNLINATADWILPGSIPGAAGEKRGHYVTPAVRRGIAETETEPFSPVLEIESFTDLDDAVTRANDTPFGLAASVFTGDASLFAKLADEIEAGNIYANLPTTFSPSALPFGGFGQSGNGRPGGRGFIRFTTREQALQWREWR